MLTFKDTTNPQNMYSYWDAKQPENSPYLYEYLFTNQYVAQPSVSLIYGAKQDNRMLTPTADDANAIKLDNIGFSTEAYNLIPFKNAKAMDERRNQLIMQALSNANEQQAQMIANTQYQDLNELVDDAKFTREKMFSKALSTGKIVLNGGNMKQVVDFQMPHEHQVTLGNPWGTMQSTPIEDIQTQLDRINDDNNNETQISNIVMNSNTFRKICKSGEVINSLSLAQTSNNIVISQPAVKQLITDTLGLGITIYDKHDKEGKFIPDNEVILIPAGPLGRMAWTDTNEDLGLKNDASVQMFRSNDGITLTTWRKVDPVATMVKVSQKILPAFDKVQNVMIIKAPEADTGDNGSGKGTFDPAGNVKPTNTNTIDEITSYLDKHGIDHTGKTSKSDLLALIK